VRNLELYPTGHEITCRTCKLDEEEGITDVRVTLGPDSAEAAGTLNSGDVKRIGEWFIKLSKELSK